MMRRPMRPERDGLARPLTEIDVPVSLAHSPNAPSTDKVANCGITQPRVLAAVSSYIRWYNETRIKVSLGSLSPFECQQSLGIAA